VKRRRNRRLIVWQRRRRHLGVKAVVSEGMPGEDEMKKKWRA
jgi:hypothetical protein